MCIYFEDIGVVFDRRIKDPISGGSSDIKNKEEETQRTYIILAYYS
jgi:hypothetical protein